MNGEDENLCPGELRPDSASRFDTIEDRHANVHNHHFRSMFFNHCNSCRPILCLGYHSQAGLEHDGGTEDLAENCMIVGYSNSDGVIHKSPTAEWSQIELVVP